MTGRLRAVQRAGRKQLRRGAKAWRRRRKEQARRRRQALLQKRSAGAGARRRGDALGWRLLAELLPWRDTPRARLLAALHAGHAPSGRAPLVRRRSGRGPLPRGVPSPMTVVLADADAAVAAALTGAGHRVERLAPAAARRRLARGQVDLVAAGPAAPARVLRAARRARVPAAVVAVSAAEAGALARLRRLPDRVIATGDAAAAGRGAVDAVADSGAGLERELRRTAAGPVPRRARLSRGRRRAAPAARPGRA